MSAGQSDRHNQICACQNTTNRIFVPVNDRDRLLFWITGFELAELLTKGTYLPHCQSSALNKPLLFSAICLPISVPLFFTLSTAFPFSIP
jgi:hypothetical protein